MCFIKNTYQLIILSNSLYSMNILKSHLPLLFCIISFGIDAQQLHTPQEVQQYMKKSTIQYQIDSLSQELAPISFSLIEGDLFVIKTGENIQLQKRELQLNKKAKRFYKKAQKAIEKGKMEKVVKFYKKAIEVAPNQLPLINEFAHFYQKNGDVENAIFWSKKGIELNPVGVEAHFQIALAYQRVGKKMEAMDHIIWAHLYNRNSLRIIESLQSIFKENGLTYENYSFQPKFKIESKKDNIVSIQANTEPWKSYAACKALWQNEEDYRLEMGRSANVAITSIEQKECLLNALIAFSKLEKGALDFPIFTILEKSLQYRMIDDFIFYEIELRRDPTLIYFLSKEQKIKIIRYLKTVRIGEEVTTE